jgi:NADH-ubiquinone oxidoreductase chain 5
LIGAAQNDIKKIIAYSTCSQLGYMVLICGTSYYNLSLFHLFNHAFFKALLFLAAGSVIHLLLGEQDTRRMGGIGMLIPVVYISMLLASIALMSFPFTSGFYSKDLIIEVVGTTQYINYTVVYWLAISAAICTAFYSAKLCFSVFISTYEGPKKALLLMHKPTRLEYTIFTVLVIMSLIGGYCFKDFFMGLGTSVGINFMYINSDWLYNVEFYSGFAKLIPLFGSIAAALIFSKMFYTNSKSTNNLETSKMYYNEVANAYVSLPLLQAGRHLFEQWEYLTLKNYGPDVFIKLVRVGIYKTYNK